MSDAQLLSGNEAVAHAARTAGYFLGTGYPGTPSSEICDAFAALGGRAQWAPNEKVALEVGVGSAYAGGRTFVTMKHVGVNVAADPLYSAAYTGTVGALLLVVGDDPGLASSQNEQDTRRHAVGSGVAVVEPADSQQAYDYFLAATALSEHTRTPIIFRMTTRVCHSRTPVRTHPLPEGFPEALPARFERDFRQFVVLPANARRLHRELREKLARIAEGGAELCVNRVYEPGDDGAGASAADWDAAAAPIVDLGIVACGVATMHAREAAPEARVLQLGLTHPLPTALVERFMKTARRVVVVEEGDPVLWETIRAAELRTADATPADGRYRADGRCDPWRFGELNVGRIRRWLAGETEDEPASPPGKPPELCAGCPHRVVFEALRDQGCVVCGDIGCYTLGALPPFRAIDTCLCMGAGIGMALGLRHRLPAAEAKNVVSVIGDSTFVHSGMTGLAEMAYNRPSTGHVVLLLDNGTTAMTGLQEHPGTGHGLRREKSSTRLDYAAVARAVGIEDVCEVDLAKDAASFPAILREKLASEKTVFLIARRPCVLAAKFLTKRAQP